ncbi:HEAT repeat domain-containing protein [Amycolatopsis japonica]|uniref:HEAT repeat domain-containing protein n=1 Tax=Amycolatopsis japonica TaxID=208439 RepID=UPI0037F446EC
MSDLETLVQEAAGDDEAAARRLIARGAAALPAVFDVLARASWFSPVGLLPHVVRRIHQGDAVPLLLEHIDAEQRDLHTSCLAALGRSRDKRALRPLRDLLSDQDALTTTRAHAAAALGDLGFAEAVKPLGKALSEAAAEDPEVEEWPMLVVATATALAKLGDQRGFSALTGLLDVPFAPTRARATGGFRLFVGSAVLAALGRCADDEDPEVREQAIDPLFLMGTPDCLDLLVAHLGDPDESVASRIAIRVRDCLGTDAEDLEAAWQDLRPGFAAGVCHRLGRPIRFLDLVDLLAAGDRPEVVPELRTITGLDVDELIEDHRIDEIRQQVAALALPDGALVKWGRIMKS